MTEEELKQKCKERAKIFQQAMESCHSSSPIDCIEWFADRIAELEKENAELKKQLEMSNKVYNGNLDYSHHIEGQLTKAKEIIKIFLKYEICTLNIKEELADNIAKAEQFISEVENVRKVL